MMIPFSGRPRWRAARRALGFRKNEDGATAVEFAMVSVPFLGLLFAIFETAFVMFVTESLESAVADGGRTILTGTSQASGYTTANDFRDGVLCPSTGKQLIPSFIKCSNLIVDIRVAASFGAADTTKAPLMATGFTGTYNAGCAGQIIVMRILYPMPVYLPLLAATSIATLRVETGGQTNYTSSDGSAGMKHMLMATSVFRNEPFPKPTGSACP